MAYRPVLELRRGACRGRGKAQADSLRAAKKDVEAHRIESVEDKEHFTVVPGTELTRGDLVIVRAGEQIPGDGDVIEGAASVDESAITGESAPWSARPAATALPLPAVPRCCPTGSSSRSPVSPARAPGQNDRDGRGCRAQEDCSDHLLYPLIMAQYGSVPMGEAYLSILAYFLFGMTAIAIGLFLSSVTESQVIAAVLTFLVLFLGYMMDSICSIISSTGNLLTKLLRCFDLYTPFSNLLNGTLDVSSIVYYVSVTALVLFLTVQSIQKRRYSMSVKNLSFSAYSTGMIAVAVALVVVVNIIMGEMPSSWTAIDMTSQKLYSLTDQTVDYVKNMQDDVTIYVLVNQDNQDTTLGQTLQRYDDLSDHITVEYVDPTVNPMFYTQYTTGNISTNSLIVVSDKRSKVIDYNDVYESSYDFDYSTYSYNTTTTGYDGEGQITSALDYVLNDNMPKVYMTTGHNELSLSNTFTSALNKENVDYETVNLMDLDAIPDDAACLFINGATSDFSSDDKDKVIDYLDNGGKVILVTGYTDEETPNIDAILSYMNLSIAKGLVVENDSNGYYRSPYYILPTQSSDSYTSGTYGKYLFLPYSQASSSRRK